MMRSNLNRPQKRPAFDRNSGQYTPYGLDSNYYPGPLSSLKTTDSSHDLGWSLPARLLAILLCVWPLGGFAQSSRAAAAMMVVPPSRLPESAQMPADSMFLRSNSDGSTYLYLEQHSKNRLVILDVTHPSHISQVSAVSISAPAFDFIRALGPSSALVCFRDNSGSGILQLGKPKQPVLVAAPELTQASNVEEIGRFGLLLTKGQRTQGESPEHDVQVVALSQGSPSVLATVHGVHQQVSDPFTGARFLLGSEGLTVVREPEVEASNDMVIKSTN